MRYEHPSEKGDAGREASFGEFLFWVSAFVGGSWLGVTLFDWLAR